MASMLVAVDEAQQQTNDGTLQLMQSTSSTTPHQRNIESSFVQKAIITWKKWPCEF